MREIVDGEINQLCEDAVSETTVDAYKKTLDCDICVNRLKDSITSLLYPGLEVKDHYSDSDSDTPPLFLV